MSVSGSRLKPEMAVTGKMTKEKPEKYTQNEDSTQDHMEPVETSSYIKDAAVDRIRNSEGTIFVLKKL